MQTLKYFCSIKVLVVLMFITKRVITETVKCPRYCTCYLNVTDYKRSVACVSRRLDNIDLNVPKRVQTLDLSNNSISVLEDRGFQNLGLIEIVNLILRHNSIRAISLHSFAGLMYLNQIDLSGNNLYQILPWTFHDNNNLQFLSLSDNPLGHITMSGPFLDIPSLEVLELKFCSFGYFSEDAFSALPSIQKLDISNNQLINLDIPPQFLFNLQELDVSKNPWPCNTNLRNLKEFLQSKSCKLIESSCDISNEITRIENKQPMFEQIVSVNEDFEDFISSEEMENSFEDRNSFEENKQKTNKDLCECTVEDRTPFLNSFFILQPIWLIFVSFQSGICVTLFFGYICIYVSRKKKKYESLQETQIPEIPNVHQSNEAGSESEVQSLDASTETFVSPDTPPPSYRDLYLS